ncbi:EAL domain-containing protein [Sphingomonas sp. SUN039]|uniref:EAL domain-containing protein n=1 Tax=Sphingomonas sp. SUN039 TaxID=2937787 RepID=UPI0021641AAE|nr:EAL domain-containing protein [Sphingomonas sp. SUN039]UVO53939.1 EAL domain-containing protein [Sphingomonas sp. SUN039]
MTYALLVAVLCGVTGFLDPLDDFARNIRYAARYVKADGSIVVISIDQKSVGELGGKFPWPRTVDATMIERLKEAGAKKIVFDLSFSDTDTSRNDAELIRTLDRFRGDVYFGSGMLTFEKGATTSTFQPSPTYVPHVEIATFVFRTNPIGQLSRLYTESPLSPGRYPGISVALSGKRKPDARLFRPDFAIRYETFPVYSYSDIVRGRVPASQLAGRDVLVGLGEPSFQDTHYLPGQGRAQGVFAHAIGAQTLKTGTPIDLGWLPAAIMAVLCSVGLLSTTRVVTTGITLGTTLAGFTLVPLILDGRLVAVDIAPGLLLFAIVAVQHARLTFGRRKSRTHEPSGLPNLVALREVKLKRPQALIAARIDNHAAIVASFAKDVEPLIAAEIVGRLKVGDTTTEVFQGDEGVYYLLSPITDRALLSEHLDGLHALFSQPIRIGERQVDISITFGVDDQPSRAMSSRIGAALMSAESARQKGLRWKFYDDVGNEDAAWHLSIGSEIDRGIDGGEFWLAYQPKLDLRTGDIVGAEALVRWSHPVRGAIPPIEFIPAAERDHRIETITRFVLERAVADLASLPAESKLSVAVNLSVPVLRQPGFAQYVRQLLERARLDPSRFTVEITESVFLSVDEHIVMTNLNAFAEAGFGISIDDFGTGFSTLETLQRIPATEVKIDQTFVKSLAVRTADSIIVGSIIKMAKGLDHRVVAEGIEDAATLRQLTAMGCDQGQGFHIGRPQTFAAFLALAAEVRSRRAA